MRENRGQVEADCLTPTRRGHVYRIDPERLDLFEEFKAKPFGPYSHELERLLNRLRMGPVKGGNGFNWRVATTPPGRG